MRRSRRGGAQDGSLLFAIGANLFKSRHFHPQTKTLFAFTHGDRAQGDGSARHRGHSNTDSSAAVAGVAAAPHLGQCLLPMNIMAKHDGQEIVASFDSQYWHCGESDEIAAPQFGQFNVCACMRAILTLDAELKRY